MTEQDFETVPTGTIRTMTEKDVEIEHLKELLRAARCPNRDCHNQGWYAEQIGEDEWTQVQCQWCDEVKEIKS